MLYHRPTCLLVVGCAIAAFTGLARGQDATADDVTAKRHAGFEKRLNGSSLIGRFTKGAMDRENEDSSQDGALAEERYDILSVKKTNQGDYWIIKTRIRYGDHDLTVPVPVEVKWADDTAVIVLNKVPVPGLGTFDARVLINDDQYAGTWRHDEVGGHLFGRIERTPKEEKQAQ